MLCIERWCCLYWGVCFNLILRGCRRSIYINKFDDSFVIAIVRIIPWARVLYTFLFPKIFARFHDCGVKSKLIPWPLVLARFARIDGGNKILHLRLAAAQFVQSWFTKLNSSTFIAACVIPTRQRAFILSRTEHFVQYFWHWFMPSLWKWKFHVSTLRNHLFHVFLVLCFLLRFSTVLCQGRFANFRLSLLCCCAFKRRRLPFGVLYVAAVLSVPVWAWARAVPPLEGFPKPLLPGPKRARVALNFSVFERYGFMLHRYVTVGRVIFWRCISSAEGLLRGAHVRRLFSPMPIIHF